MTKDEIVLFNLIGAYVLGLDTAYPELSLMRAVRFTGFKSRGLASHSSSSLLHYIRSPKGFGQQEKPESPTATLHGNGGHAEKSHLGEQGSGFTC